MRREDAGEVLRRHVVRSDPRQFRDGWPQFGSAAFEALPVVEQVRIADRRAGVARLLGEVDAVRVDPPPRYLD